MRLKSIEKRVGTVDTRKGASVCTDRITGPPLQKIRTRVMLRDEYTCQICGRVTAHGEVDHKTPLCDGGSESDSNRWYLCVGCHQDKSKKENDRRGRV